MLTREVRFTFIILSGAFILSFFLVAHIRPSVEMPNVVTEVRIISNEGNIECNIQRKSLNSVFL